MEINIAICDDESAEIEYLTLLVRRWANVRDYLCKAIGYGGSAGLGRFV